MKIIGIMACAQNGVVGNNGVIPWHYPEEFKHFRNVIGTSPVIMGRKTFETLPESILKDRRSIVVSRSEFYNPTAVKLRNTLTRTENVITPHSVIPAKAGTQYLSQRRLGTSETKIPRRGQLFSYPGWIRAVTGAWFSRSGSSGQARGQVLGPSLRWDDAVGDEAVCVDDTVLSDDAAEAGCDGAIEVAYMIGGAEIANLFLKNNLLSEFILTKLHHSYQGDAILNIKAFENWKSCVINETADYCIYKLTP